jgi:hypothetical protein
MSYSNISASLSAADKQAVLQAVQTIKSKLPFLVNLNEEERKKLRKMGHVRSSYVKDVYLTSLSNPDSLPGGFDLEEYSKDMALQKDLDEIFAALGPICEGINDTEVALGIELMKQSDACYGYLKVGAKKSSNQNLNDAVKKIAGHTKRKTKTPPNTGSTPSGSSRA